MPQLIRTLVVLVAAVAAFSVTPARAIEIQPVVSPGGIKAWLVRDATVPVISMSFSFRGGAAMDPNGKDGRADMVSGLLDEGAGALDSQAFQRALETISASLSFDAGLDRFSGSLRTLSAKRDEAFRLLRLAITAPRFDAEPVERIRTQMLVSLKQQAENPRRIAGRTWFSSVFPNHPYGRPVAGTEETVAKLSVADLKQFVGERLARDNLVIGVSGDIAPDELGRRLDETFGQLPAKGTDADVSEAKPAAAGKMIIVRKQIPQSVVIFGQVGIKRRDPDYYTAFVMNHILGGGGFSSRLTEEVREKRGLAYSVYSYLSPLDRAGLILGGLGTQNANVAQSIDIVRQQWGRLAEEGVTEQELVAAKTYLNGSFPLRFDSTRRISQTLVAVQFHDLGLDYLVRRPEFINAVTRDDIRRVARRLLDSAALTVVVVGDPQGLKAQN